MRRVVVAIASIFAGFSSAFATGYDDFARGVAALNRGEFDTAVTALSSALSASDLNANLMPVAYLDRGNAYRATARCQDALADAKAALSLRPEYPDALSLRGGAHQCLNDHDAAIADFTALIALQPRASSYDLRATARWYKGDFAGAAADLSEAVRLDKNAPYRVLWLAVAQVRSGTFNRDQIAAAARSFDDDWPAPILAFYLGEVQLADVEKAAEKPRPYKPTAQLCEADFYIAEWQLGHADKASARPHLERAVASCPSDYIEYARSKYELERIK